MKKQYTTPEIDVRKYAIVEVLTASTGVGNDDDEIDLDKALNN